MPVIEVDCLRKRYGEHLAVDGVSFGVERSEIFGIVGPNGAGKTTTVECGPRNWVASSLNSDRMWAAIARIAGNPGFPTRSIA
jgi:ABC-type Na+ transport system ATPase subunit NatA